MDFLHERCNVKLSSKALQRVIERGLGREIRPDLAQKSLLPLVNSEAHVLCSDVDVTRAHVAFGRGAIPKLKREVLSSDPLIAKQALSSLLDMVHDPERGVEAVRLKVVPRLVRLMLSSDSFVKQHTLMILEVLATQPDGIMDIVHRKNVLENISSLLEDNDEYIRLSASKTLRALANPYFGIEGLIQNNFIPIIIFRLQEETVSEIKIILLDILEIIMDQNMAAKLMVLNCGGIKLAEFFNYSEEDVRSSAASVFAQSVRHPEGKEAVLKHPADILSLLTDMLEDSNVTMRTHAAAVLMFVMCKTEAKLRCLELQTPSYLVQCAQHYDHPGLQLNAIKALASFSESPAGQLMLKGSLGQIQAIRPADGIVLQHKKILISLINRVI